MLTRDEALVKAPGLNRNGLRAAAIYYDAQVEFAERLVVENMLSAKEHGATVVTYARVQKLTGQFADRFTDTGGVVEFVDTRTGATFSSRGRIVINAAGTWVDDVQSSERPSKLIGARRAVI